jgi:hypothetical protein
MYIGMTSAQLVDVLVSVDADLDICNSARKACVKCIQTGRKVGAIR